MRQLLIKASLYLLLLCSAFSLSGQNIIYTQSLGLSITSIDTANIGLSWNSPPQALSCSLLYESDIDTTIHPITNFTLDAGSIPRVNPIGNWEKLTISFALSNGTILIQSIVRQTIYGAVIVIEEDIFSHEVIQYCRERRVQGMHQEKVGYSFDQSCRFSSFNHTCNRSDQSLESMGYMDPNLDGLEDMIDTLVYAVELQSRLEDDAANDHQAVISCGDLFNDPGSRQTQANPFSDSNPECIRLAPNPFYSHLLIRPHASSIHSDLQISIVNPLGKRIYNSVFKDIHSLEEYSVNTRSWASGIYIVSVQVNGEKSFHKVIKQ